MCTCAEYGSEKVFFWVKVALVKFGAFKDETLCPLHYPELCVVSRQAITSTAKCQHRFTSLYIY